MRKNIAAYLFAAMVFLLAAMPAYAAGKAQIVGLKQKEGQLLAWVKGAGSSSEVTASLGKTPVENVTVQTFQETGMELRTLILIDNSLSVEGFQATIRDRLLEVAAARRENEYFALGTVSDHVTILLDFTKDYMQLRDAFNALEYQYQDTYITDALYDYLLTDPFGESDGSFDRILLISDGMDNKSLGYTKDELQGLLKDSPMPIYAIGVDSGNAAMNEYLENMFALARANSGDSLLLNDLIDGADSLIAMLDVDRNNLAVTAEIPESAQDGSLQTLTLRFGEGGVAATLDNIRMPLLSEQPPATESEPAPTPEPKSEPEPEPEPKNLTVNIPMLAALGITLIIIVVLVVLLLKKGKNPSGSTDESKIPVKRGTTPTPQKEENSSADGKRTFKVGGAAGGDPPEGAKTRPLPGRRRACSITLKDIHDPNRLYQKTIDSSLIIGALSESDICIDYDNTVSRKQCQIILENGGLYLVNHSKTNKTELNGIPVDQRMCLTSGSIIKMGRVEMAITFQL